MTPSFSYTIAGRFDLGYVATVRDFNGAVLHETATHVRRSGAEQAASSFVLNLYETTPATFRIVRQVVTARAVEFGGMDHAVDYVADVEGDWVEKDYGNGCRSYRMARDCSAKGVARIAAKQRGAA